MRSVTLALLLLQYCRAMTINEGDVDPLHAANLPLPSSVPLGVNWGVHPRTGFGVLGHSILGELWHGSLHSPFYPAIVSHPHSQSLVSEYPRGRAFKLAYLLQQTIWQTVGAARADVHSRLERPLGIPLVHALENGPAVDIDEIGFDLWGSKNAAFVFFEDLNLLDETWLEKARLFDVLLCGCQWNTDVLTSLGLDHAVTMHQGVDTSVFHPPAARVAAAEEEEEKEAAAAESAAAAAAEAAAAAAAGNPALSDLDSTLAGRVSERAQPSTRSTRPRPSLATFWRRHSG